MRDDDPALPNPAVAEDRWARSPAEIGTAAEAAASADTTEAHVAEDGPRVLFYGPI